MTNDNPKWNVEFCGCLPNHGRCKYCLSFPETPKPLPSEPKCEHDGTDRWCDYKNNPASPFVALKEDCPECPICKQVEPSVEALEWIQKILPNTNEQIDHLLRERPFELYHILCVDIPDVIEKALATHKLRNERNRK